MAASMLNFYRSQAAQAQADANDAALSNVRERCERSVAAWTQMADRAERAETQRAIRENKAVAED